jgi:hypothetical protein
MEFIKVFIVIPNVTLPNTTVVKCPNIKKDANASDFRKLVTSQRLIS